MKKITLWCIALFFTHIGLAQSLPLDFEVSEDDNFNGFNGTQASVVVDPTDASNQVLEMIGAGVDFDGAAINLDTFIDLSNDANNSITLDIWAPDGSTRTHLLKLEGGSSGATELFFDTTVSGWQTVTIDFGAGLGNEYPVLVIFTDSGSGNTATGTYYIDDITGPNGAVIPTVPLPAGPAPVPTFVDANTYSIYNDTNSYTLTWPFAYQFGGGLQGDVNLETGGGTNNAWQFNLGIGGYGQGEENTTGVIDNADTVSFDYWITTPTNPAATGTGFRFVLISDNTSPVTEIFYEIGTDEAAVTETWTTVTIPLSFFTNAGFDQSELFQWKIDPFAQSVDNDSILYLDNILITGQVALSVDENTISEFRVFPNPTNTSWNINSTSVITNIDIYDVLGKRVVSLKPNSIETDIDASTLKTGVYFARLNGVNGSKTIRLIKN